MFSDIDECNSTKPLTPCDQICENIPGSYNCSCQKGFNLVNGSRCEGIVTILLMFLHMISTGAWISKRWWNVAIKNNWQLGQGSTGWIFSCSLTCYEVTFYCVRAFMLQLPYIFFFKNSVGVLLCFFGLEAQIFLWLLLHYREEYSLLLYQFPFHVLRYRWVQFDQTSYSMRSDLWEYSWKLQLLLWGWIQPC